MNKLRGSNIRCLCLYSHLSDLQKKLQQSSTFGSCWERYFPFPWPLCAGVQTWKEEGASVPLGMFTSLTAFGWTIGRFRLSFLSKQGRSWCYKPYLPLKVLLSKWGNCSKILRCILAFIKWYILQLKIANTKYSRQKSTDFLFGKTFVLGSKSSIQLQ